MADYKGMQWDNDTDLDIGFEGRDRVDETDAHDEQYVETTEDRKALLSELRAQIESGTYKPSIGRISVSIFGDLASK